MRPVCGSDARTYHNACELQRQACLAKRRVILAYRGECGERGPCHNHECGFGSVCVAKGKYAVCECPSCTEEFEPVCGTDGISYTNICKLKREACEQKAYVQVSYDGLCNGCENRRCEFYAVCESDGKTEARCICPQSCIKVESTICGTDGVTYLNECEMRVAACNKQQYVVVGSRGPCDMCQNVHCKYGARCENGRCICPTECPVNFEPVCATDGTTYHNECEMRKSTCVHSQEMNVLFYGECSDDRSSGQELRSVGEGCREKICNFGSRCEYDAEGLAICVCNFECPEARKPVCGSDGMVHSNDCKLKEESCKKQLQIYLLPMTMCEDHTDMPCDGEIPLVDPLTRQDYYCGEGSDAKQCPPSSYCHKTDFFAKCCREMALIKTCSDSTYGCCPDGQTAALGNNFAGCPSLCNCNRLGSYGLTCDAETKQCSCKPGVGGLRCDRCEPGYWGLHMNKEVGSGCLSCNCNLMGSVRDDCEQMSGRCVCKEGIGGNKCDTCPPGTVLGPDGCTDVSIAKAVAGSCSNLTCLHGATCKEKDKNGLMAQCVCDFRCPFSKETDHYKSVCGNDGNTYGSECQMRLFSCRYQKIITVANEGPCKRGDSQGSELAPTSEPVRRSTVQRMAPAEHPETKSTRDTAEYQHETRQLTTRPTLATPLSYELFVQNPSFSGRSYLELPRLQAYTRLSLELEFRTFAEDGILLYNGQTTSGAGDFVSLAVKDGYVEFRYNLGNGPVVLRSPHKLHLGKFHRLVARRYLREGLLTLDGHQDVAGRSEGSLKSLDLTENLYLGYIPTERKGIFDNIAVNSGIVGCIRRLKIGKKIIDLRYPSSKDIIRGRGIQECGRSPCSSMPCRNNGICEPQNDNEYRCSCLAGFTGRFCESSRDPCYNSSCFEGSTCMKHEIYGFVCVCPPDKTGKFCEKASLDLEEAFVPDFHGNAYLEFPTLTNVRHAFSIEIWFMARSPDGTLLYNGQTKTGRGDFLAVTLSDGFVRFRFDLGTAVPTVPGVVSITSDVPISLNEWHSVKISRLWKNGTLQVDNGTIIVGESVASLTELNVEQNLYIGGVPSFEVVNPLSGIEKGFNGAVQRVIVNGEVWENLLALATWSHAVQKYRGLPCWTEQGDLAIECLHGGVCIPRLNQATCRCALHFVGPKCERRVTKEDLERPVSFDGDSFLSIASKRSTTTEGQRESNIEVTFRTRNPRGLLVWTHGGSTVRGGDYLALAVVEGHVQLSFNLGKHNGYPFLVTSEGRVDDSRWHTAFVERNMRLGTLTVDNSEPISNTSAPGATELNTDGVFWIGGCPTLPAGLPHGYYSGFNGCLERVVIDGDPLHLVLHSSGDLSFCDGS